MTTIVLADDHPIVRMGIRALLESEPGYEVVGEAGDGLTTLDLVERLKPDILVVDVMMPGLNGLEVTRRVRQRWPQTRVVVLSMYSNEPYVLEALRSGAASYVLKDTPNSNILEAIRAATAGQRYLSPPIAERAIEAYIRQARSGAEPNGYEILTTREREVFQLAAEGLSNREIGGRFGISPRTAETHRTKIMRKLDLDSQTDLLRYALRHGIIAGVDQPLRDP